MADNVNDNHAAGVARAPEPDAHGQAAFLLTESLLHALVSRSVLSVDAAVEIVEIAADVKAEVAEELGDSPATLRRSLALLTSLSTSLRADQKS